MTDHTVFVLGAGFTRAFIPQAPLLTDPYPLEPFLTKFSEDHFPHAHKILRLEEHRTQSSHGRFDLERLMTRLDSSMPHDFDKKAVQEVDLLRHDLYDDFVKRLSSINSDRNIPVGLLDFAKWCVNHQATASLSTMMIFLTKPCGRRIEIGKNRSPENIGIPTVDMAIFVLLQMCSFKAIRCPWGVAPCCC